MTATWIDEAKELIARATPGPWTVRDGTNVLAGDGHSPTQYTSTLSADLCDSRNRDNAAFIAAARDGWPRAILATELLTAILYEVVQERGMTKDQHEAVGKILRGEF